MQKPTGRLENYAVLSPSDYLRDSHTNAMSSPAMASDITTTQRLRPYTVWIQQEEERLRPYFERLDRVHSGPEIAYVKN